RQSQLDIEAVFQILRARRGCQAQERRSDGNPLHRHTDSRFEAVDAGPKKFGLWQLAQVGNVLCAGEPNAGAPRMASLRWHAAHSVASAVKLPPTWQSTHGNNRCTPVNSQPTRVCSKCAPANVRCVWHSPQLGPSELWCTSSLRWHVMQSCDVPASNRPPE